VSARLDLTEEYERISAVSSGDVDQTNPMPQQMRKSLVEISQKKKSNVPMINTDVGEIISPHFTYSYYKKDESFGSITPKAESATLSPDEYDKIIEEYKSQESPASDNLYPRTVPMKKKKSMFQNLPSPTAIIQAATVTFKVDNKGRKELPTEEHKSTGGRNNTVKYLMQLPDNATSGKVIKNIGGNPNRTLLVPPGIKPGEEIVLISII
jgi:hypothetical protein